jgi:hypothetical protein
MCGIPFLCHVMGGKEKGCAREEGVQLDKNNIPDFMFRWTAKHSAWKNLLVANLFVSLKD